MDYAKESLRLHGEWKGKIEMVTRASVPRWRRPWPRPRAGAAWREFEPNIEYTGFPEKSNQFGRDHHVREKGNL